MDTELSFRTEALKEFGTLPPDYVSEDITLAIKIWLKENKAYHISHREYLQVGKGREVSVQGGAVPFQKFASGSAELAIGRQLTRLMQSNDFEWYQKFMLFFTLSFFTRKPVVLLAIPVYIVSLIFIGVSGFGAFPLEITFAFLGIWFSQMISFPGVGQAQLERGVIKGFLYYLGIIPTTALAALAFYWLTATEPYSWALVGMITALSTFIGVITLLKRGYHLRRGIEATTSRFFGLVPRLVLVFLTYIPTYAVGLFKGLAGSARFNISPKGWELGRVEFFSDL